MTIEYPLGHRHCSRATVGAVGEASVWITREYFRKSVDHGVERDIHFGAKKFLKSVQKKELQKLTENAC